MSDKILRSSFLPENKYYLAGSGKKEVYLYVELHGGKSKTTKERVPLNISMVIDRSGSMSGAKLDYCKKALDFVIDNLNASDTLSIVQYDDRVEVVTPSAKVKHKEILHQKVSQIQSRGSTNLSGGMLEGYSQVKSTQQKGLVNRVLLLSDGLANVGITDPQQLQNIAQQKFRDDGIALSTFGVGAHFNEDLMTNLAEYGGANYYFIDSPDKIPAIFKAELQGLLAVVTQNTSLKVKFPSKYLKFGQVYGYPASANGDEVSIQFNDVFAEEEKAVLIRFDVTTPVDEDLNFDCTLSYDDVVETMGKIEERQEVLIRLTSDEQQYKAGVNQTVLENIALFVSNFMFEEAMREADKHNYEQARQLIAQVRVYMEAQLSTVGATPRMKKRMEHVQEYESKVQNMEEMNDQDRMMYQKFSKMQTYAARKRRS